MDHQNTIVWALILLAGIAAGAAFIWFGGNSLSVETTDTAHSETDHIEESATTSGQQQIEVAGANAVILMDAFHWGWVPQVLQSSPGVKAVVAEGAQGSAIHVPQGTRVKLILRNAGGNSQLHQIFEERFHDYFIEKYGEAWEMMHQADHTSEDAHNEDADTHNEEETDGNDSHEEDAAAKAMMNHMFFLESYNIQGLLLNDPEHNIQFLEFTADIPGEFKFMCMNFCGMGHEAMQGVFIVSDMNQN